MTERKAPITGDTFRKIVARAGEVAKLGLSVHPHMLRHWFATDMVRRNVPANVIMKQMRHKTINTTMQIYAQVHNNDFVDALPDRTITQ